MKSKGPRTAAANPPRMGVLLALLLSCAFAKAAVSGETLETMPSVLLFELAESKQDGILETRFENELRLALDGFRVHTVAVSPQFAAMPLPERLKMIRRESKAHGAVATIWIEQAENGVVLLNLVAMSTGRALVRIIEIKSGPATEKELAFAAWELLGEAYMFSPRQEYEAVNESVEDVRKTVSKSADSSDDGPRPGLMPLFETQGGIHPQKGPSWMVGGGLALDIGFPTSLFFRATISGLAGPRRDYDDGAITGFGLGVKAAVGYHFELGRFKLGPALGAALIWRRLEMDFGEGDSQSFSFAAFRGDIEFDIQLAIGRALFLTANAGLGAVPISKSFRRLSDDGALMDTPFLDWHAMLGFLVALKNKKTGT